MSSVFANGRAILHKGDGLSQCSGPPDVCKTPSPGGPVPIPYPNVAKDADLANGAESVRIKGSAVIIESSNLSTSTGDEAGTAGGGILSSKTKGKLTFGSASSDVLAEGKGVVRFMDVTHHNGNTFNTVLAAQGELGVAYGDDPMDQDNCLICDKPKAQHKLEPTKDVAKRATDLRKALARPGGPFRTAFVRGANSPDPNRPLKPGVMIGVLQCQCEAARQYAGLAGTKYEDGSFLLAAQAFNVEAAKLGLTPVVAPPAPPPLSGFHPPSAAGGFGAISQTQFAGTLARVKSITATHRGNAPLTCAAPKMIQKCLQDGHKPGTLIEMWVGLEAGALVKVARVLAVVASETGPGTTTKWLENRPFSDGEPVPSCTTCQIVCTEMLCNTGQPPCP